MTIQLSDKDRRFLDGEHGPAARKAMAIIVRMAEVTGVDQLMDVEAAHIDGCGLLSDAGLEFAESLAELGARVSIPTTLSMGPLDLEQWERFDIDKDFAGKGIRQGAAYTAMGCVPAWTCAPYQGYLTPRFGRQIAWGESNAVCYANSVLGARTNRYADYFDICAAITGRVPRQGLHLDENRRGQILIRLDRIPASYWSSDAAYAAMGYYLGKAVGEKVAVLDGLPEHSTDDQLKALGAAAASSGAVALFHAVGVTPEAPTLEAAFRGNKPEVVIDLQPRDLAGAWRALSSAENGMPLDVVVVGCPHFSFEEFQRLAELLTAVEKRLGRTPRLTSRFIIITSHTSRNLAERAGLLDVLARFQVEITMDTCVFHTPMVSDHASVLMTNSGKCAYYSPGELGMKVAFGDLDDCVTSALEGIVRRKAIFDDNGQVTSASEASTAVTPEAEHLTGATMKSTVAQTGQALVLRGEPIIAGSASATALAADEPLSLWGGFNPKTGEISDRRHPLSGRMGAGKVLVFTHGRGSSTGSAVLLESIRRGVAPAAIINRQTDAIAALGAIVADEMYDQTVPMVRLSEEDFHRIGDGDHIAIEPDGTVTVSPARG